ncbi:hypothetical protein EZS27_011144 [termite gut metagenome]|uniref:Transposase IS4-like domain-containing protein n=1 Tax=termite gut metagenome TaxID=433724 RepID=A0A5J4S4F2_9ZZZZ
MHNLKANFDKMSDICKQFGKEFTNEQGNISRCGMFPRFSDLEVVALSLTAEALSIDSENLLFVKFSTDYKDDFPHLTSRRQYNDRRKYVFDLTASIRRRMASSPNEYEGVYCVDSKPVETCRLSRSSRSKAGREDYSKAPSKGYCASQNRYYYGYKLHKDIQLDLFQTAHIRLEVPYRSNQKDFKPWFKPFRKLRKRVETVFSQLDDQFLLLRNYAKDVKGIFTCVLAKIASMTALQYLNKINKIPIGRAKYALC